MPGSVRLPVDQYLPAIEAALVDHRTLILSAEPGAGKTTRVPLRLLDSDWCRGQRLLLLEPRRAAARLAAARMAEERGEQVGGTVGYRTRHDSRIGAETRLEVVTEGVFNRLLLADPALESYAGVIFDEVHERTLQGDTGLALALQSQALLRPELRVVLMSATLDSTVMQAFLPEAAMVQVPVAQPWPVQLGYRPAPPGTDQMTHLQRQVEQALADSHGAVLVFLPGQREILEAQRRLVSVLGEGVPVQALYGALPASAQQAVLRVPEPPQPRVILSTNIAETSLTIADVETVIDCGLCRRPVFHPATGLTRLETARISRQSADQRCGRAGRTRPGRCWRLWPASEVRALADTPEIGAADLSGLVLDMASLGCSDSAELRWLTPPPLAAWQAAQALLRQFGALGEDGRITEHGQRLQRLPLAPRLGQLLLAGRAAGQGTLAAAVAAALDTSAATGPLTQQVRSLLAGEDSDSAAGRLFRRLCEQPAGRPESTEVPSWLLACAWPDRIAQRREGTGRYLLSSGRGARLAGNPALAECELLVVYDLSDGHPDAQIRQALALSREDIERALPGAITREKRHCWDSQAQRVRATRVEQLGAIRLSAQQGEQVEAEAAAPILREQVLARWPECLAWRTRERQWQARVGLLHRLEPRGWPDVSDAQLRNSVDDWLMPWLEGKTAMADVAALPLGDILQSRLDFAQQQRLAKLLPEYITVPSGRRVMLDYTVGESPVLAVKLQEMFSCDGLEPLAGGHVKITVHLLSPAGRPLAVTADLSSFWRNAWPEVRGEMRGRYPKHPWPEDPLSAIPSAATRGRQNGDRK